MDAPQDARQSVTVGLLEHGAIQFGAFRLKLHRSQPDAPLSPFYIDLRRVRSVPSLMDLIADVYAQQARVLAFDVLADVPTAGTPLTAVLAHKTRTPMISPRLERKDHGSGASIDGIYERGQVALVIDDLLTAGHSKLEAVAVLRDAGLTVRDVLVLIDREQGGAQQLQAAGLTCHAAFRFSDMLDIYRELKLVADAQLTASLAYLRT